MNILSPEQIEALKKTPHGLRFLQRVAEALDEYLRADENQQIIEGVILLGAGGVTVDEAVSALNMAFSGID